MHFHGPGLARRLRAEARARRILDRLAPVRPEPAGSRRLVLSDAPRIGVLLQWGIGDAVLSTPFLAALRATYPDAELTLIGRPWLHDLFRATPFVDEVVEWVPPWNGGGWARWMRGLGPLRSRGFDLAVSIRFDPRDIVQLRLLRARHRVAWGAAGGAGWLSLDLGVPPSRARGEHVREDGLAAARSMGLDAPMSEPRLDAPRAARDVVRGVLAGAGWRGEPVTVVSRLAGHPIREWPGERFTEVLAEVSDRLGFVVVLRDPARDGAGEVRIPDGVPGTTWGGTLSEVRALLAEADVFLGCDSGVMHLAAATGCRVVAVFSAGSPEWFGPSGDGHRVVLEAPMPCRPCLDRCIHPVPICGPVAVGPVVRAASAALEEGGLG